MRALDKATQKRIDDLLNEIDTLGNNINNAHSAAEEQLQGILAPLIDAISAYNEKVEEFNSVMEDVVSEAQSYFDDRSEKWQEGDAGEAYSSWISALENTRIDPAEEPSGVEVEMPDVVDINSIELPRSVDEV
jgi:uncharacterized protein YidB (DUF937 family)